MAERYTKSVTELVAWLQQGRPQFDIRRRSDAWRKSIWGGAEKGLYTLLYEDGDGALVEDRELDRYKSRSVRWFRLTEKGRHACFTSKGELVPPPSRKPPKRFTYLERHKVPKMYMWPDRKTEQFPDGMVLESSCIEEDMWCLKGAHVGVHPIQIVYTPGRPSVPAASLMELTGYVPLNERVEQHCRQEFHLMGGLAAQKFAAMMEDIDHVYDSVALWMDDESSLFVDSDGNDPDRRLITVRNAAPWSGPDTPCWFSPTPWVRDDLLAQFSRGFHSYMRFLEAERSPLLDRLLVGA